MYELGILNFGYTQSPTDSLDFFLFHRAQKEAIFTAGADLEKVTMRMEKTPPFKGMQKKSRVGDRVEFWHGSFFFARRCWRSFRPKKKEKFMGRVGSAVLIFPTAATLASSIVQPKFLLSLISSDCLVYGGGALKKIRNMSGSQTLKFFPSYLLLG